MGFGFGPGASLMKAYKANLRQKKDRKKLKDIKFGEVKDKSKLVTKKISEAELDDFKRRFQEQKRQERIKGMLVFIVVSTIVLLLAGYFWFG